MVTGAYKRLHGVTRGYSRLQRVQGVIKDYSGLERVRRGYTELER